MDTGSSASRIQSRKWSSGLTRAETACARPDRARFGVMHAFGVGSVVEKLRAAGGGYEVVHESAGVELGVYVLVAPEADRQQPHDDDEIYVVLEGSGVLDVDGTRIEVDKGRGAFVPAHVEHRFVAYEQLAVLVIFTRPR